MPHLPNGGFQAASHGSERRSDFDLLRRVHQLEHENVDLQAEIVTLQAEVDALQTLTTPSAWTALTLQNSWVNFGAGTHAAQYRKIGDLVHIRGAITGGALGVVAFTLPVGFRPPALLTFPTWTSDTLISRLDINTSGQAAHHGGAGATQCRFNEIFSVST